MRLSVIIPTRDRAEMLVGCLETLSGQNIDEIIVIDDGSSDETSQVAVRYGARCITQLPSGLNVARNNGAAQATGDILAFVDDDIYADTDWAAHLREVFEHTRCDAVGGKIVLKFEAPKPKWLHQKLYIQLSGQDFGDELRPMANYEIPLGANCAVTRSAFEKVNGFVEGLDREGSSLLSNGDKDFFMRLHGEGALIMYSPLAWVTHRVPESRLNKRWFRRRTWFQGVGDAMLKFDPGDVARKGKVHQTLREVRRLGRALPILLSNVLAGNGALSAQLWVLYCLGRIAGIHRSVK
ncbi:MAG: glycosyltransferase family 2 protein [Actinomycetota bacterium]